MTKIKEKIIYFESRLDDVERELHSLPHRIHELEDRRKKLLNTITELHDKEKETINQLNDLGFKKEVISEGITAFTLDSKTFR
jgi:uncharacterized coiled-coil DUF342 family protein